MIDDIVHGGPKNVSNIQNSALRIKMDWKLPLDVTIMIGSILDYTQKKTNLLTK